MIDDDTTDSEETTDGETTDTPSEETTDSPSEECARGSKYEAYTQCGGDGFEQVAGEEFDACPVCPSGFSCFARSQWYSSCNEECPGDDWDCATRRRESLTDAHSTVHAAFQRYQQSDLRKELSGEVLEKVLTGDAMRNGGDMLQQDTDAFDEIDESLVIGEIASPRQIENPKRRLPKRGLKAFKLSEYSDSE